MDIVSRVNEHETGDTGPKQEHAKRKRNYGAGEGGESLPISFGHLQLDNLLDRTAEERHVVLDKSTALFIGLRTDQADE